MNKTGGEKGEKEGKIKKYIYTFKIRLEGKKLKQRHERRETGKKKREKKDYISVACGPRFPYLSFPNAYVLVERGRGYTNITSARVESLREPIT